MDLIYANEKKEDVGVLLDYSFDLAFGTDENDFELTLQQDSHCCGKGYLLYIENTEYGGIVDSIKVKSAEKEIIYSGRTFSGILENKVIKPDEGNDYLTVSGEANAVLNDIINRLDISDLFVASTEQSNLTIASYQFERYVYAYTGIKKMLKSIGGKLKFNYQNGKVVLSALPLIDYTKNEQFDTDQTELDIERKYSGINHVVCLGKGELKERQVIHLYADADGNISKEQSIFGVDEIEYVYDHSNAESFEELEKGGYEILEDAIAEGAASLQFNSEDNVYDIGDIIGSKDIVTDIEVTAEITKKIVTISKGEINIEYKVGD